MTRIYTKTGDTGETSLFGGGRVSKAHVRVEAYGAVDELNSTIGWAITQQGDDQIGVRLQAIQADLFTIGAQLATPSATRGRRPGVPELPPSRIGDLELWIDQMEAFARLGREDVAVYDGSWAEWGARDDGPVATGG